MPVLHEPIGQLLGRGKPLGQIFEAPFVDLQAVPFQPRHQLRVRFFAHDRQYRAILLLPAILGVGAHAILDRLVESDSGKKHSLVLRGGLNNKFSG